MPGGLLQIYKLGPQDIYLFGNPQLTYFKTVYKRHTNFSMEMIRFDFEGTRELANDVNVHFRCKIPRNGDLLNRLYFVINIPDIYSGYDKQENENSEYINYKFQWVPSLGTQMIIKCSLIIGNNLISELYGQWIEIWHELFLDTGAKNKFDEMVGNLPDLFLPANNGWNSGIYPTSSLENKFNEDPISKVWYTSRFKANPYLQPPSIRGRKLYVPLPFWFCTNPGLSLPLIALQYHDIQLEFEMRPIRELYTIIETRNPENLKQRTAPSSSNSWHNIGNFITSIPPESFTLKEDDLNLNESSDNSKQNSLQDGINNIQGWNMDPYMIGNFIFLDNEERNQFANRSHEYLIEQVFKREYTGINGTQFLNLDFNHPIKYLSWFGQRDDIPNLLNAHNNYTNWLDANIPPESDAYLEFLGVDSKDSLFYYTNHNNELQPFDLRINNGKKYTALLPTKFNFRFYNQDILKSCRLLFNGNERFSTQDSTFFKNVQSYQHNFKSDKPGIYMYSFALEPSKYQPSGSCNFSNISNVQLEIETNDIQPVTENSSDYNYNIHVIAVNYNILRIVGGMAGTAFSN